MDADDYRHKFAEFLATQSMTSGITSVLHEIDASAVEPARS